MPVLYPEFKWMDVALGGVEKRNNLIPVTSLKLPRDPVDCYRTVFRYSDAMKEHFDEKKTVAGYRGPVYADWMPIDIDSEDLEEAHETSKQAVEQLARHYEVMPEQLGLFFSGAKGFHLLLPAALFGWKPSPDMPKALKWLARELFDGIEIDPVIYDTVRLFRLANTRHSGSGLYKVQLDPAEMLAMTVDEIKEVAREPRASLGMPQLEKSSIMAELYEKALRASQRPQGEPPLRGEKASNLDRYAKQCIVALLQGVKSGQRNETALRLAVYFRRQGLPARALWNAMRGWNQENNPPLEDDELRNVCESGITHQYDFGCNDPILAEHCSGDCERRGEVPAEEAKVHSVKDAEGAYLDYVRMLKRGRVVLGLGKIDDRMRGMAPGEVCQVIARSSVGKTALLLNILRHLVLEEAGPALFFSLEMPLAQVYERMAQIATREPGWKIEQAAMQVVAREESFDAALWPEVVDSVSTAYSTVWFVDQDGLSLEDMQKYIQLMREHIGDPRVVAVDYMGRMRAGYGSPYEQASRVATGLKQLAKDEEVAVISLHQVSRAEGRTGAEPITLTAARDSGVVEEATDFLIGLWRPERETAQNKDVEPMKAALLKNRRGREIVTTLEFNKPVLVIQPMVKPVGKDQAKRDEDAFEPAAETQRLF